MVNVALNGFGRIGKALLRILMNDVDLQERINLVIINDVGTAADIAYAFNYDTTMGIYAGQVRAENNSVVITSAQGTQEVRINITTIKDTHDYPWSQEAIDVVIDCTGAFTHREQAQKHLDAGAGYVLISAPAYQEDKAIVYGFNEEQFDPLAHRIISLGSCTTGALIPTVDIIDKAFGVTQGCMSTIHAYTNNQGLLDRLDQKDPRRGRAGALNIVPTTTGASEMIDKLIPHLSGNFVGTSIRVPVGNVSLIDCTLITDQELTVALVNNALEYAALNKYKKIMHYTREPLVSSDFKGNTHSVIIDSLLTQVMGNTCQIFGWYDNEWGYSNRLKDFLWYMSSHI